MHTRPLCKPTLSYSMQFVCKRVLWRWSIAIRAHQLLKLCCPQYVSSFPSQTLHLSLPYPLIHVLRNLHPHGGLASWVFNLIDCAMGTWVTCVKKHAYSQHMQLTQLTVLLSSYIQYLEYPSLNMLCPPLIISDCNPATYYRNTGSSSNMWLHVQCQGTATLTNGGSQMLSRAFLKVTVVIGGRRLVSWSIGRTCTC